MTDKRILIDALEGDPLPQLLACLLSSKGAVQPDTPDGIPGPDDALWFPSQHGFLSKMGKLQGSDCHINIVIRRPSENGGLNPDDAEHAVISQVAQRLSPGRLRFHALTEDARRLAVQQGYSDCNVLEPQGAARHNRPRATIDPSSNRILLPRDTQMRQIGLHAVNWARLSRDYDFAALPEAAPDWHDLARLAAALPKGPDTATDPLYVFITPNGVGIGHLTRQLAIARALQEQNPDRPPRIVFWSFSRAAIIAQKAGHGVLLRHTAEHLGAEDAPWQKWETQAFAQFLRQHGPAGIVADGSSIAPFVVDAMRQPGCHHARLFWVQRGMWQADADIRGLSDILYCDKVLIPGDLAHEADTGPTSRRNPNPPGLSETRITPPVTLAPGADRLARGAARRALGIKWRRRCLVSLGGDAFARTETLREELVQAAARSGVHLVWAQSPLATRPNQKDGALKTIAVYPLNRYYDAFDGVIAAAGYNTFHELMQSCDMPVLFLPTANARLDDQPARARFAADAGWADVLDPESDVSAAQVFADFFAKVRSGTKVDRNSGLRDGAGEMAREISALTMPEHTDG